MKKLKVYIAGPYTQGDIAVNVSNAMDAAEEVLKMGHTPFIPHLMHFQHMLHHRNYDEWLNYGVEWLKKCDVVLRLPGLSFGSDFEVNVAQNRDMPVFESLVDFKRFTLGMEPLPMYDSHTGELDGALRVTVKTSEDKFGRPICKQVETNEKLNHYSDALQEAMEIINKVEHESASR